MTVGVAVRAEGPGRAWKVAAALLLAYAALVASHEGEFWPFSIYPMFSQGGKPWVRTVVYELDPAALDGMSWRPLAREALPGVPFAAREHGVEVIDLAKYISMTERWDEARVEGLRRMMGEAWHGRTLVFHRVSGRLVDVASAPRVLVDYQPYIILDRGAVRLGGAP